MENVILSNGLSMPMEGFGAFQVPDADVCEQAVLDALSTGYRLIDTAAAYMNEKAVGNAIKKSGIDRSEILLPPSCGYRILAMKPRKSNPDLPGQLADRLYRLAFASPAFWRYFWCLASDGRSI